MRGILARVTQTACRPRLSRQAPRMVMILLFVLIFIGSRTARPASSAAAG
jgi:hypothetical protein